MELFGTTFPTLIQVTPGRQTFRGTLNGQKQFTAVFKSKKDGEFNLWELETRKNKDWKKLHLIFRLLAWLIAIVVILGSQERDNKRHIFHHVARVFY